MKHLAAAAILFFGICSYCFAVDVESIGERKIAKSSPKEFLVAKLQKIADSGALFEPIAISRILDIPFKISAKDVRPFSANCSGDAEFRINQHTIGLPGKGNWFHSLPSGMKNMRIPVGFGTKVSIARKPSLEYYMERHAFCNKRMPISLEDGAVATLHFKGLSGYACIVTADIERLLPKAVFQSATDGVYFYAYQAMPNDNASTNLAFYFYQGVPCAISAIIEQDATAESVGKSAR